jgi:hypothetical protein
MMTRRNLLQRASWAMAAAAFPRNLCRAADALNPVIAELSTYMSEARSRAVPDEVIEKIKQHTLDTVAAMVSGSQLLAGRQATRFASECGGEKISAVVGSRVVCGPIEAALARTKRTMFTDHRVRSPVVLWCLRHSRWERSSA